MTLFVSTPRRRLEINDAYVMALTFVLMFALTKILKDVNKKLLEKKKANQTNIKSVRGGGSQITFSNDDELGSIILACISDNEQYLIKNPRIKKLMFNLVKEKMKDSALVITPNLMRFLALTLKNKEQNLIVKVGNIILSSENRIRLTARVIGSAVVGVVSALASATIASIPYIVLLMLISYDTTEHCGYNCNNHFEQLPSHEAVNIYQDDSSSDVIVTDTYQEGAINLYKPMGEQVSTTNDGDKVITKVYKKSRKKARLVKFSDFKKADPVLSTFDEIEEPNIKQNICDFEKIDDIGFLE